MARQFKSAKLLASLITMSAWLIATNHCAVAMTTETTALQSHEMAEGDGSDHHHPGQQDHHGQTDDSDCCKDATKAAPQSGSSPKLKVAAIKLLTFLAVVQRLPVVPKADLSPHYLDSGPPASFAEIVLQRSVLAHAPPFPT
jgi:hypothetical protein